MEFLIGFLIFIGIFLLLREFWCWFWKINQRNKLLEDIRNELRRQNSNTEIAPLTDIDAELQKQTETAESGQNIFAYDSKDTSMQLAVAAFGILLIITIIFVIMGVTQ